MAGTALRGIADLMGRTGSRKAKVTVTYDQIYAQMQHEALEFQHPRGGEAKYLEKALMGGALGWIQTVAGRVLTTRYLTGEWGDIGPKLAASSARRAPREFGDLMKSAGVEVHDGATLVHSIPPEQPRLTDIELEAKDWLRSLGLGYR